MSTRFFNTYAVKAATENVLNFVNEGLGNLGLETKDNIKDAIECLWNRNNDVEMSTFCPIPDVFDMDSEVLLESYNTDVAKGVTTVYMWGETRSYFPYRWLEYIKDKYNLNVFIYTRDDMHCFQAYGEIDSVDYDYSKNYCREYEPKPKDFKDRDDYTKALYKFIDELYSVLHERFEECVEGTLCKPDSD